MLDIETMAPDALRTMSAAETVERVRAAADRELPGLVQRIDGEGHYPETLMREFGRLGAYARHLPDGDDGALDMMVAINAMAAAGEHCLSTSFCMWCQDALGWYIFASGNDALKQSIGAKVARGEVLGGTGLSNPMKSFFGIEPLRLKGTRVNGGYVVRGALPYVSNLGEDHCFAVIFDAGAGDVPRHVMAVVPCAAEGLKLGDTARFVALDGTRTFTVQMRDVLIPDAMVIADPVDAYIRRIRAGFVLLQTGMGFGVARDCIRLMEQTRSSLGHVNKYLDVQPEPLAAELAALEATTARLAATPFETDPDYWRAVIETRLGASEIALSSAHAAMLHCGARGYVINGAAQRRLREAYFVAIVTPATKQLKKMLAGLGH